MTDIVVIEEQGTTVVEVTTPGPQGASGVMRVGTVTTGPAGSQANVTNGGTTSDAIFNFVIPRGDVGDVTPEATAAKNTAESAAAAALASQNAASGSATAAASSQSGAAGSATAASASAATASTKASEASASAAAAAASQSSATSSATLSTNKAAEAASSATAAATSASDAAQSANAAVGFANSASASSSSATTNAASSATSASKAQEWATKTTSEVESGQGFGAKKYAQDASALANAAEIAAAGSLAHSQTSALHALEASNSADDANASAVAATISSNSAASSASAATSQAATATTQASNAAASASTASSQAGAAATSAATATAQATTATTKAAEASASASAASVSAAAALASQTASAGSAAAANTSAGNASGSAANALAIYGTAAAQQAALSNAQAAASVAQGFAASAASVVQQDLSGVNAAALHRSPNAVTAMFLYDTSKDSDGGAWTEKCQSTSWFNEALTGKWLGAHRTEYQARRKGASVSATELLPNGDFSSGTTGWNITAGTSVIDGQISVNAGQYSKAWRTVTVEVGKTYRFTGSIFGKTANFKLASTGPDDVNYSSDFGNAYGNDLSWTNYEIYFTATTTTVYVTVQTDVAGVAALADNLSLREVTALTTSSNDYFQLTADGRFYRLNKNLITRSEEFDNAAWATQSIAVTANAAAAPNGTMTADLVYPISSGNTRRFSRGTGVGGGPGIFSQSLHLKFSGIRWAYIFRGDGGAIAAWFDLQNGVVGTVNSGYTAQISPSGNGWYRCSVTSKDMTVSNFFGYVGLSSGDNSEAITANGTDGVLFWGSQLEYGAVTAYETNSNTPTITEVFRGNKRKFPKLAGIVAESQSVTIYDLTEAGRPMWMRFMYANSPDSGSTWFFSVANPSCAAALGGKVAFGTTGQANTTGLNVVDFPNDELLRYANNTARGGRNRVVANRLSTSNLLTNTTPALVNGSGGVNAVAMTILPDAPVDPVTGLKVPTIWVGTAGGLSVIRHNGAVHSSIAPASQVSQIATMTPTLAQITAAGSNWWVGYATLNESSVVVTAGSGQFVNGLDFPKLSNANSGEIKPVSGKNSQFLASNLNGAVKNTAVVSRPNKDARVKSVASYITNSSNTGHMVGDIRRAYLADVSAGSVSGTTVLLTTPTEIQSNWTNNGGGSFTSNGGAGYLRLASTLAAGRAYTLTLTVNSGSGSLLGILNAAWDISVSAPGTYSFRAIMFGTNQVQLFSNGFNGTISNILLSDSVPERTYKNRFADITGTLTQSQVASAAQLVAYSGFSAANYLREPYSADLDFGTGEWSMGAWVNVPTVLLAANFPVNPTVIASALSLGSVPAGAVVDLGGGVYEITIGASGPYTNLGIPAQYTPLVLSMEAIIVAGTSPSAFSLGEANGNGMGANGVEINSSTWTTLTTAYWVKAGTGFLTPVFSCANHTIRVRNIKLQAVDPALVVDRNHATGPNIRLGVNYSGRLTATAFDGTTTRTVTTTAAYNTGTWLKVEADYTTDGTLTIAVNGVDVAVTRGTPLLTLNSQYNLVLGSEDFGVTPMWNAFPAASITKNAISVGGINLSLVVPSTASSSKQSAIGFANATGPITVSFYCKAAGYRYLQVIDGNNGAFGVAVFDAVAGTFVQNTYSLTTNISDVGSSIFKVTITSTNPVSQNLQIGIVNSATGNTNYNTVAFAGDGTSGMYIGGIQRVSGSVERPYQRVGLAGDVAFGAPLTIGNSYAGDAPFPGSIALLKASATVPTAEQSLWMYEQEKQMFRDGAQVTLPDAGSIVDLTYDDATDKWIAVSATNESEWSGLVRTSVTPSPAGSYTKVTATSGVQLQARSTTNPGVDITIPAYGLREELVKRGEAAARLNAQLAVFDYVGGFTANTTSGSTAIASVAGLTYPVSYIGARISGAGIPANTTIVGVSGTTLYLSAAATATASTVQISFFDFVLPVGHEAKVVLSAGAARVEGLTKDFTRLFDGFKETIRFGTVPGYNVPIQIQAARSAA